MINVLAQVTGALTIIATILGLFQKEKHKTLGWFLVCNLTMLATYFLLGKYLAVILIFGSAVRTLIYYLYNSKNMVIPTIFMVFFEIYFVAISLFLWREYADLFMLINLCLLTWSTWQNNMSTLRTAYVCSAILLFTYDIVVGAYVQSISEVILLVSSLISVYKLNFINKIEDIVLDFYQTIAPSYHMEVSHNQNHYLVYSEDIDDVFNNFGYVKDIKNYEKEIDAIKNELESKNRQTAIYFQAEYNDNIFDIMEAVRKNKLLYHDVWMKLRSGHNTKYKKCLLEGVEFRQVGEKEKDEILRIFKDGFINFVGDSIYKYEEGYVGKYERTLTDQYLKEHKITPYMAYYKGEAIALLFMYTHNYYSYVCQITTLMPYRRQGVASALIRYAIGEQRKKGIEDFYLITEKYTYLEAFYLKNNFEEISQGFCIDLVPKEA